MIDVMTHRPLYVSTDGTAGPYISVPLSQLEDLCNLLEARGVPYGVEANAISLDGSPMVVVVNLGRGASAGAIQAILDGAR